MAARVETYAGYKADERPLRFNWNGRMLQVASVLQRWIEPQEACFRVLADDGREYVLRRRRGPSADADDEWMITPPRVNTTAL